MRAELIAAEGEGLNRRVQLNDGDEIIIGLSEMCDIQILKASLSRTQCEHQNQGGGFVIKYLARRKGAWPNGIRVAETRLDEGDEINPGGLRNAFKPLFDKSQDNAEPGSSSYTKLAADDKEKDEIVIDAA